jgi:hypothetical protein
MEAKMKRILILAALVMLLPAVSMATFTINPDSLTSMNARLQFLITADTTGGVYPDSCIKWVAVVGTTNPPTARADSQSFATPKRIFTDTADVGGFYNNQVVYCRIIATLRHGTTTTTYTSPVDSAHTKNITTTITNIADSMTYRFAMLNVAVVGSDSIPRVDAAQFRFSTDDGWEWFTKTGNFYSRDSIFLSIATPDTLRLYGASPYDLRDIANSAGQYLDIGIDTIFVRVVVTGNDTVGTDTSNVLTIALPAIPAYQSTWINGNRSFLNNHLEGGALFKSSLYSFTSNPVYIKPFRKFKAQARVFGTDNNQPCDSLYIELYSWNYGAWAKVATLVTAQIDTARTVPVFYDLQDSTNVSATFLRIWGDSLDVRARSKDTTGAVYGKTIDTRGFEYRLDFWE